MSEQIYVFDNSKVIKFDSEGFKSTLADKINAVFAHDAALSELHAHLKGQIPHIKLHYPKLHSVEVSLCIGDKNFKSQHLENVYKDLALSLNSLRHYMQLELLAIMGITDIRGHGVAFNCAPKSKIPEEFLGKVALDLGDIVFWED